MKVAIIGFGFVGRALKAGLRESTQCLIIDPLLQTSEKNLIDFVPDIIFICVPTPMLDDGCQDISIVNSVINNITHLGLPEHCKVVIKSTILPSALKNIKLILPNIVYNPEFLREKHANYDFINSNLIVIGGEDGDSKVVGEFYKNHTDCTCTDYIFTDLVTASFIKYTINSFLATKVSFFNELNQAFTHSGARDNWGNFISYLSKDPRMGDSHMAVPGHDGKLGFGGACLPKDSIALLKYVEDLDLELSVLNSAININNTIREKYNIDDRELVQNINFKKES